MNKEIFVKLLQQRQYKTVRSILDVMNEADIASLLSKLDDRGLALAFRSIPKDKAAEVFANMDSSILMDTSPKNTDCFMIFAVDAFLLFPYVYIVFPNHLSCHYTWYNQHIEYYAIYLPNAARRSPSPTRHQTQTTKKIELPQHYNGTVR